MTNRRDKVVRNLVGCVLILALSCGCVDHEYFDYAPVQTSLLEGDLLITIQGTASSMAKEGNTAQRGAPYYLGFTFRRDVSNKFVRLEILDLIVSGDKSKKEVKFADLETTRIIELSKMDKNDRRLEVNVATEIPVDAGMIYEPVRVRAKIRIYDAEGRDTEVSIDIRLDEKYRREKRSGFFDKWMSV